MSNSHESRGRQRPLRSAMRLPIVAACLLLACSSAALAGHDDLRVGPAMKRYAGKIIGLADPDPQGRVYGFRAEPLPAGTKYTPGEMKGWRLTLLSGKRFSAVFEVQGNGAADVVVTPLDGPLTDVAVNDLFVIEQVAVERQPK
jgi:hypothetical protein